MARAQEPVHWIDGDRVKAVSAEMTVAREAFDRLYYHSTTNDDLIANAMKVSKSLAKVRRLARKNSQRI